MSIPLFFAAVRNVREDVYVDGGVLNNFPVKLFDRVKYLDEADGVEVGLDQPYYANENTDKGFEGPRRYVFNKQTLGFRLDSASEIGIFRDGAEAPRAQISGFIDYAKALIGTVLDAQNNQHLHSDDWQRTVYIDTLGLGQLSSTLECGFR